MSEIEANSDEVDCYRKEVSFFTPQLAGKARQLGCPKIVLDHVGVYIYIYIYIYVCAHHNA